MKKFLPILLLFLIGCTTCNKENTRIDETKNKALENLCNGKTAIEFLKKGTSIAREYVCMCQQAAKGSDQNACEKTINLNNGKDLIQTCKKLFGIKNTAGVFKTTNDDMKICKELFNAVK